MAFEASPLAAAAAIRAEQGEIAARLAQEEDVARAEMAALYQRNDIARARARADAAKAARQEAAKQGTQRVAARRDAVRREMMARRQQQATSDQRSPPSRASRAGRLQAKTCSSSATHAHAVPVPAPARLPSPSPSPVVTPPARSPARPVMVPALSHLQAAPSAQNQEDAIEVEAPTGGMGTVTGTDVAAPSVAASGAPAGSPALVVQAPGQRGNEVLVTPGQSRSAIAVPTAVSTGTRTGPGTSTAATAGRHRSPTGQIRGKHHYAAPMHHSSHDFLHYAQLYKIHLGKAHEALQAAEQIRKGVSPFASGVGGLTPSRAGRSTRAGALHSPMQRRMPVPPMAPSCAKEANSVYGVNSHADRTNAGAHAEHSVNDSLVTPRNAGETRSSGMYDATRWAGERAEGRPGAERQRRLQSQLW